MTKKPDLPGEPSALVVRRMPIDALQADPRNAMTHPEASVAAIESSLREFGQQKPIVVDQTGMIVAGHGTVEAAKRLGWTHVEAAISDLEGPKRDGYAIADNRTAQLAKWHDEQLAATLASLAEAGVSHVAVGFTDRDLARLLAGEKRRIGSDDPPPIAKVAVSQVGEVYQLGPHRVACGSSTDAATWDAVMLGDLAHCLWTDPPYGVSYQSAGRRGKANQHAVIKNDALSDDALELLVRQSVGAFIEHAAPGAAVYVAAPPGPPSVPFALACRTLGVFRQRLIWAKSQMVFGRSDYHYRHEDIYYGFAPCDAGRGRGPSGGGWYGDDAQTSVMEFPSPHRSDDHPTQKPIALIGACLQNSARKGDIVADGFGGSGSTMIAADVHGSVARLIELDPLYVDVIRRRWTKHALVNGVDPGPGALDP